MFNIVECLESSCVRDSRKDETFPDPGADRRHHPVRLPGAGDAQPGQQQGGHGAAGHPPHRPVEGPRAPHHPAAGTRAQTRV